jgi:hypothetical protein
MKTLKIISLFTLSMIMALVVSASKPDIKMHTNPDGLTKIITAQVTYPDFAIEKKITGFVVVELSVNTDGNIRVERINASQPELREYVMDKLEQINVQNSAQLTGKPYYYRFDFQLL